MSIESVMPSNWVIVTIPQSCHHITSWWRNGLCWGQQVDPDFSFIHLTDILPVLGFPDGSNGKEVACKAEDLGSIPGSGRFPREGNGNPSSILAWEIPWTEEPGYSPWGGKESDMTE